MSGNKGNPDRDRYLTDAEKRYHLDFWDQWRREFAANRPELERKYAERGTILGGLGYPDPDIYDLTDKLNSMEGICTTQSCSGHRHPEEQSAIEAGEDIASCWSGQLWLRLDADALANFLNNPYELVDGEGIERVNLIFHEDMGEVLDITFAGLNVGPEALARSSRAIVAYMESLLGTD